MPQARLIYNPNAGRYPPADAAALAAEVLREAGWAVDVSATRDADHVTELAAGAAAENLDALIVAGGDGSIGRALPGLIGTGTALGVLPTGTANVWAQELGLQMIVPGKPETIRRNAQLLAGSAVRSIDVGECNGVPFLLWAGLGLDAMVVRKAEQNRSHLKKHFIVPEYFLRALATASHWEGAEARIHATEDDGPVRTFYEGRFQLALVSNIRLYAGGYATVSPNAALDDGVMDLWIFEGQGAATALRTAWNIYRGIHVDKENVRRLGFRHLTIETADRIALHTDGDPRPSAGRIELTVHHRALKILLPETAPADLLKP